MQFPRKLAFPKFKGTELGNHIFCFVPKFHPTVSLATSSAPAFLWTSETPITKLIFKLLDDDVIEDTKAEMSKRVLNCYLVIVSIYWKNVRIIRKATTSLWRHFCTIVRHQIRPLTSFNWMQNVSSRNFMAVQHNFVCRILLKK